MDKNEYKNGLFIILFSNKSPNQQEKKQKQNLKHNI